MSTKPSRNAEPFLAVFVLLAGSRFERDALASAGALVGMCVAARSIGFIARGFVGAHPARAPAVIQRNIDLRFLPQAGVAIGLALLAEQEVPSASGALLPLVIASTIVFEIVGPVIPRWRLRCGVEPPA